MNPRIEGVRQFQEKRYAEPVRLKQRCRIAVLKETNLCRQFKKHTGLSTGEYLKQRRPAAALQQLRTTRKKVATICHACGVADISTFNRTFRTAFKQSPSDCRKSISG
jgi:AraC family transcriptional regulator